MISIREFKETDAPLMLEWMHDPGIQRCFKKNMMAVTLEEARKFCMVSRIPKVIKQGDSLHFAIVDEDDEYLGTISLKEIDLENRSAEYAITTRKIAQGHGVARQATGLLLKKAFGEYRLHRVYLNVLANNEPAIRLYERCGFTFEGEFREHLSIGGKYMNWKWYGLLEDEYNESMFERGIASKLYDIFNHSEGMVA